MTICFTAPALMGRCVLCWCRYHYCLRIFNRFSYNIAADLIDRPDEGDAAQLKQARANKRMSMQNTTRQAYRGATHHPSPITLVNHHGCGPLKLPIWN